MALLKVHKFVAALPGTLEANALYFVRAGAGFDLYATNASGTIVAYKANQAPKSITITIDGMGQVITAGSKIKIPKPPQGTIIAWTLIGDPSGSISLDIKKGTYAAYPTVSSITGSAPPSISSGQKGSSSTLTGWSTSIGSTDILEVSVTSVSLMTYAALTLEIIQE